MNGDPRTPLPREVEGFAEFRASGLTPARPTHAPDVMPGVTAQGALRRLALVITGGVAVALATLFLLPKDDGTLPPSTLVVFLLVVTVGVATMRRAVTGFREVLLRELQAGYVTTTFEQGGFWIAGGRDFGRRVVGWDWSGVWVLRPTGEVVSSPQADSDPPGVYPSPHEPGRQELWTGHQWTGFYTD